MSDFRSWALTSPASGETNLGLYPGLQNISAIMLGVGLGGRGYEHPRHPFRAHSLVVLWIIVIAHLSKRSTQTVWGETMPSLKGCECIVDSRKKVCKPVLLFLPALRRVHFYS